MYYPNVYLVLLPLPLSKSSLIIDPLLCTRPFVINFHHHSILIVKETCSHQNHHQFSCRANVIINILGEESHWEKKPWGRKETLVGERVCEQGLGTKKEEKMIITCLCYNIFKGKILLRYLRFELMIIKFKIF